MANTSKKHKEKKSQKRKDRQLERKLKQESKAKQKDSFMIKSMKEMKGVSKSLPGFLAKNIDTICKWLNDYCILFQEADDAYIDYIKNMDRSKRDEIVQDYVNMRVFISLVNDMKCNAASNVKSDDNNEESEKEESEVKDEASERVLQQAVG